MNKQLIFFILLFSFASLTTAELVELTDQEGRSMRAMIDSYDPDIKEVGVRRNGEGSVIRFSTDLLNLASIKVVEQWYQAYVVDRLLRYDVERTPGEGDTCYYSIEITNSSNIDIAGLRAEYEIPMRIREQVVKQDPKSSDAEEKKKKQAVKYETIETSTVKSGEFAISTIPARRQLVVKSDSVVIKSRQTDSRIGKGKDNAKQDTGNAKMLTNRHSVQGILIRIYSGITLLKTVESKHGIDQLIEQYRN
jgi:hypothetical protein